MAFSESEMGTKQLKLKWKNQHADLINTFDELRSEGWMTDVTLVCEGETIKAHKIILSASSHIFRKLFRDNQNQNSVIILQETKYSDLKAVIDFMYKGEVSISLRNLQSFLKTAETLQIRELAGLEDNEIITSTETKSNISDNVVSNSCNRDWESENPSIIDDGQFHYKIKYSPKKIQKDISQPHSTSHSKPLIDSERNISPEKIEKSKRSFSSEDHEKLFSKRRESEPFLSVAETFPTANDSYNQSATEMLMKNKLLNTKVNPASYCLTEDNTGNKKATVSSKLNTKVNDSTVEKPGTGQTENIRNTLSFPEHLLDDIIRIDDESSLEPTIPCRSPVQDLTFESYVTGPSNYHPYENSNSLTKSAEININESHKNEDTKFQCEICKKEFTSKNYLLTHKGTHTKGRPYQCRKCRKGFVHKSNLINHKKRIHPNDKIFKCEYCPKELSSKAALTTHRMIHTGERPFKCDRCPKGFITKAQLLSHIKRKHLPDNNFLNNQCGEAGKLDYFSIDFLKNLQAIYQ